MRRALRELVIVGLPTSQAFHLRVMEDPEFQRGELDITYLERRSAELLRRGVGEPLGRPLAGAAALLAQERRAAARPRPPGEDRGAPPSARLLPARREALRDDGRRG